MLSFLFKKKAKFEPQDWQAQFKQWAEEAPEGPLKRYYEQGMISLDTPLKDTPLLALDLETTGLNPQEDEIISLGAVPMDHRIIRCNGSGYWMAKPQKTLNAESVTIHEITHSELAEAPPLHRILDDILQTMARKVVVVHCVSIEREFLLQAAMKIYGYPLYFPVLDTMEIERQSFERTPLLERLGKRKSLRLGACRERYRLPRYKAHHALTDALSSAELLQAQIRYHMDPETTIGQYWL